MSALRIERDDDVLRITLSRPETRNAFDAALVSELADAFVDVGKARAVVLGGDGPSFCAGADIGWMRASVDLSQDENVADANALRRMLEAIEACPAPVVALVQGHALGGGVGLVAAADIAVAHERAVFAFSEVKLGIIPAVISPFALRKIGASAARRYFLTGERFDAATALRIGLVHEVTSDLGGSLALIVAELRTAGPRAARAAKRLVLDAPRRPGNGAANRRAASQRGRTGRVARVSRAPAARVGAAVRSRVTALFAIFSAILAGGADFLGGFASRRAVGIRVAVFAQAAGLPFAFTLAIAWGFDRLTGTDIAWSAAGGAAVGYGFACFYTAMGRGLISVVAPVAAVTGAVMPVVYALVAGERPGWPALVGIVIALVAVSVVSIAPSDPRSPRSLSPRH